MTATKIDYDIRAYEPQDEPAVLALLERALAGGPTGVRTATFFRWKHADNPFGPSIALVATVDGAVVGFRTFVRWRFTTGTGRTLRAVRAVDTATDPAYQGQGIFSRLTRTAIEHVRDDVALIFNTPNSKSLPGYLKLGWQRVGAVPIRIRPVRPLRFLRGAWGAVDESAARAPTQARSFDPAHDVVADREVEELLDWASVADGRLRTDRSPAYLRWRYARVPDLGYRAVTVEDGGRLVGLAIGRARSRGRLAEFTLAEVIARPGDRRSVRLLLKAASRGGHDHVATHLPPGTDAEAAGRAAGYWKVPGRGMTLVAYPFGSPSPDPLALSSWRLSLGDLEVF